MEIELPIWQICLHKKIPLNEIRYGWTYTDLLKAQAIMQMEQDYDLALNEAAQEKAGN